MRRSLPLVRISAFVHTRPRIEVPLRVRIRLLPGISPFRLAMEADGRTPSGAIGEYAHFYPMDRMLFDRFAPDEAAAREVDGLPRELTEEIGALPVEVGESITYSIDGEVLWVRLPLAERGTASLSYCIGPPLALRDVLVEPADGHDKPIDYTERLAPEGTRPSLAQLHHQLLQTSAPNHRQRQGTSPIGGGEWP